MTAPIAAAGAVQAPAQATSGATAAQQDGAAKKPSETTKAAESFERMLVGQLTKVLADSALPEESASAATNAYKDMLPDALTEALMSGGGIGLAKQLEEGLK
ncbi:MAG TPA: rod-binding protein [Solirubrobacteraceae bacterium]|nr:rod-binding protein [Solirubrobacteraceae bacterium]